MVNDVLQIKIKAYYISNKTNKQKKQNKKKKLTLSWYRQSLSFDDGEGARPSGNI